MTLPKIVKTLLVALIVIYIVSTCLLLHKQLKSNNSRQISYVPQILHKINLTERTSLNNITITFDDINLQNSTRAEQNAPNETKTNTTMSLNILLLYADDWRHDTLSAAESSRVIQTPFLDSLAKQGVRFRYNCVTTSICWISRATLFTGQFYSRHNQTRMAPPIYFYDYWNETYPGLLRDNGYYVGHVGKWHLWDFPSKNYDFSREYEGSHWYPSEERPEGRVHVTKKNEEDALEFLRSRPKDKPFCLTVAFFATHAEDNSVEQYKPQPESMHMYVNDTVPVPLSATQAAWEAMPSFFTDNNEGRVRWRKRFDKPEKFQSMMKNYFRMASEVDSACQAIVQELEQQGNLDNTLIIFTTDNGYFHNEHLLADKFYPHQESIRVPLIIRDPRMPKGRIGTTNDDFTLSVDLAPTILSAAGIVPPSRMQGRDISVLYRDDLNEDLLSSPWREEFYYELPILFGSDADNICPSEALVRKDFKLINWTYHMQEQLFDLRKDPWELEDVFNDTKHKEILSDMRKQLSVWREAVK